MTNEEESDPNKRLGEHKKKLLSHLNKQCRFNLEQGGEKHKKQEEWI